MDSMVCKAHLHPSPLHPSLLSKPPTFSTFKPYSPRKTLILPLHASHKPSPSPQNPNPPRSTFSSLTPLIRPLAATVAAAAALLAIRYLQPPLSWAIIASPPAQSETLADDTSNEQTLEDYLDSHPDDIRSLRALMEIKVKSGRLPEAIAIADRLILLEPKEKDLPLLKAHLQSYSGDMDSAKQGFESLLADNPYLVEAYHGLVMTTSQSDDAELGEILQRVEGAIEVCKKEKRKEDLRDFKLLVAQIRVIEGKYEEALKVYQELVKEEPRDFRPYLCQGIIYTLMKKKGEAEKQFQKYRRLVPKGHPYAQYFDDNMVAMKVFSQIEENKRKTTIKS